MTEVSLRAGSLFWVGDKEPRTGEKNEARKSEPANLVPRVSLLCLRTREAEKRDPLL